MNKKTYGIIGLGFVGNTCKKVFSELEKKSPEKWEIRGFDVNENISQNSFEETASSDVVFICVPTPTDLEKQKCDVSIVSDCVEKVRAIRKDNPIVIKSTVPPGTTKNLDAKYGKVFFNPEFLREASAVEDYVQAEYQLLGITEGYTEEDLADLVLLFQELFNQGIWESENIVVSEPTNYELAKYGRNSYLATRLSFFQELREISDKLGCDSEFVKNVVCADPRIGPQYSEYRGKWGGKCLVKDINALIGVAKELGVDPVLLQSAWERNMKTPGEQDWLVIPGAISKQED